MSDIYKGYLALDGSILIALAVGEKGIDEIAKSLLNEDAFGLTHELAVSELLYILCRKVSYNVAKNKLNALKASGFIKIIPISDLIEKASKLKCERHIALADCYTLALAEEFDGKAVFAKAENEIINAIKRSPFNVDVLFALDRKYVRKGETAIKSF